MQIFKPTGYSTTKAVFDRLTPKPKWTQKRARPTSGLGATSLSLSNDMMLGMALGGVAFLVMKKKGMLGKRAPA
jgi:hypothetical protein